MVIMNFLLQITSVDIILSEKLFGSVSQKVSDYLPNFRMLAHLPDTRYVTLLILTTFMYLFIIMYPPSHQCITREGEMNQGCITREGSHPPWYNQ